MGYELALIRQRQPITIPYALASGGHVKVNLQACKEMGILKNTYIMLYVDKKNIAFKIIECDKKQEHARRFYSDNREGRQRGGAFSFNTHSHGLKPGYYKMNKKFEFTFVGDQPLIIED